LAQLPVGSSLISGGGPEKPFWGRKREVIKGPMKILMASTEMAPLAQTGGLGEVVAALSLALQEQGHAVSVVLPLYRSIRESAAIEPTSVSIAVPVGGRRMAAEIFQTTTAEGIQVFLVGRDEYFDRSGLYGVAGGRGYDDNAERFIFFSRAVVELACHMDPPPDLIHCHDWPTALVPVFLKERGLPFGSVLTLHQLAHQGCFDGADFSLTHLAGHYYHDLEFHGQINFLKAGILHADALVAVSERFAREVLQPGGGHGLDGVLRGQARKLWGILNGNGASSWDPARDPCLPAPYSPSAMEGKLRCRAALLETLGLEPDKAGPVFAAQGTGGFLPALVDQLLADDSRLIVLSDVPLNSRELRVAQRRHAGKLALLECPDETLLRRTLAAADLMILPPPLEPSGISIQRALKYGAVPITEAVGGLSELIRDEDPTLGKNGSGNGFVCYDKTPEALADTLRRAKKVYRRPREWAALRERGMKTDFSWLTTARRYVQVYQTVSPVSV